MASGDSNDSNLPPPPPQLRTRSRQRLMSRTRVIVQKPKNRSRSRDRRTRNRNGDLVEDVRRVSNFVRDPNHRTLKKLPWESMKSTFKTTINCKYDDLFELMNDAGYYEDIKPVNFAGMWLQLRIFPFGKDASSEVTQSALGVQLLNPYGFLNDTVNQHKLKILVRTSNIQTSFTIVLGNFALPNGAMQYGNLNITHDDWKQNDKVSFELIYKQEPMMDSKHCMLHQKAKLDHFRSVLDLGAVHIYSSKCGEYTIGESFVLRAVDEAKHAHIADKENNNTNNKEEATNHDDGNEEYLSLEYVRCDKSLLCAFSLIFKNEITGLFKTSSHFSMNLDLKQIECLVYYMCNREIHKQADPCTMAAIGHYLDVKSMIDEALQLCITELCLDNFMKISMLFQLLTVDKHQGLSTLANWIKKEKEDGNIDLDTYAQFKHNCKYVENLIDCTKPADD